ncbi:hypothetical protein EIN_168110 [Entamoeba invadens IP1]|uniref:Uncharacterized protein n=1 Tax=Entamoeba invadens IP1 TaxID=370355 RepID=A0A0A1TVN1_ENTIV|nr:hypothetical protein EIN_168110 [Entamoeba invadens IP1]ELP84456.1 hypothetical protein EIN_168110 [Entamoeba invadens IP1]|eukprot:XP_004183802.1 hypothetical protein EIN_168110 [Entamoeba invadens IP1]
MSERDFYFFIKFTSKYQRKIIASHYMARNRYFNPLPESDFKSVLAGFYLQMVNEFASFSLKTSKGAASNNLCFPQILHVCFDQTPKENSEEEINVNNYLKMRIENYIDKQNMTSSQIKRFRKEETLKLLEDLIWINSSGQYNKKEKSFTFLLNDHEKNVYTNGAIKQIGKAVLNKIKVMMSTSLNKRVIIEKNQLNFTSTL